MTLKALKRKGNPLNVKSNKQLLLAHSLTHSKSYQKGVGVAQAKREHAAIVKLMKKRGMKHDSQFKPKVRKKK